MAIFVGDRLIQNYTGIPGIKQVKRLSQQFFPDPQILFTVTNTVTATQSDIQMQSYVGSTQVVFSIKRGATYISTVEQMNSFSVSFQPGDEVTILGQINIFTIVNTVLISSVNFTNHYRVDKIYIKDNTTLTTVILDNCGSLNIVDMRNGNITSFTCTTCYSLHSLYLTDNNNLVNLDMSQMQPTMGNAYINRCGLTYATVVHAVNGYSSMLEISENPLGTLDLTVLTMLGKLRAFSTNISTIDFSTTPQCSSIRIDNNNLTIIDTSNLANLNFLRCHNNPITSYNFTNNPVLATLACTYTNAATLDFTNNPLIASVEYIGYGGGGGFLTSIIWGATNNITQIRVSGQGLSVAQINTLFIAVDGNGNINGTECRTDAQSPAAPPSGAGATAKANLIAKGWSNVITD